MSQIDLLSLIADPNAPIPVQRVDASTFHPERVDESGVLEGEYTVNGTNKALQLRNRESDPIHQKTNTEPYRLPMGPLRNIDPYKIQNRSDLMFQLYETLPINEFNLPIFLYRPDFLDHNRFATVLKDLLLAPSNSVPSNSGVEDSPSNTTSGNSTTTTTSTVSARAAVAELQNALSAATFELEYKEGYPTYKGFPLWERLPWESPQEHAALNQYLTIDGVRQISRLISYNHDNLQQWFHTNYWVLRARSFDLFCLANNQRLKMQRVMRSEDDHYKKAGKMLTMLENVMESEDFAEKFNSLDPDAAVSILAKLVTIQRISVGLPSNGPQKAAAPPKEAPTAIIMQQIVNKEVHQEQEEEKVDLLLESPDNLAMAQQLIISVNGASGAIDGTATNTTPNTNTNAPSAPSKELGEDSTFGDNEDLPL